MKDLIFITGNQRKADYLSLWLKLPFEHQSLDLDEIQSLDPFKVVEHKARQAYDRVKKPVLVEDVSLTFLAMGRLPGTLIRWFMEDLGLDALCRLVDGLDSRAAVAGIIYALYDGTDVRFFEASQLGSVPDAPRGDTGFGWNPIFIPEGSDQTYGEMDEVTFEQWNIRAHAITKLREHLTNGS